MSTAVNIPGGQLAKAVKEQVATSVVRLAERGIQPRLAVVLASDDPSALSYAQSKEKAAAMLGVKMDLVNLGREVSQRELEITLQELSADPTVHGILLEFPLGLGLDANGALGHIGAHKDVDGLTPVNLGLVMAGREVEALTSATAQACIELAETKGSLSGKLVGLVGRGRTVGRPLAGMLINRNATVTVCHTRTPDLARTISACEVVIVAIGKPHFIRAEHLAPGQIVIDAGINILDDSVLGDVHAESARYKVAALTPVPGGVGPLTSAIIYRNLMKAIDLQRRNGE